MCKLSWDSYRLNHIWKRWAKLTSVWILFPIQIPFEVKWLVFAVLPHVPPAPSSSLCSVVPSVLLSRPSLVSAALPCYGSSAQRGWGQPLSSAACTTSQNHVIRVSACASYCSLMNTSEQCIGDLKVKRHLGHLGQDELKQTQACWLSVYYHLTSKMVFVTFVRSGEKKSPCYSGSFKEAAQSFWNFSGTWGLKSHCISGTQIFAGSPLHFYWNPT